MIEIIKLLPPLGIAVLLNIALGTWYNIDITKIKFDKYKLLNGMFKAILVSLGFIGVAYILSAVPQIADQLPMLPTLVILSGILLYTKNAIVHLTKILGIKTESKDK